MTEKRTPQAAEKYIIRLPEGMREKIANEAKQNNRSMNAEIVARLQETFNSIPLAHMEVVLQSIANLRQLADVERHMAASFAKSVLTYGDKLRGMYAQLPESIQQKKDFREANSDVLGVLSSARQYLVRVKEDEIRVRESLAYTETTELDQWDSREVERKLAQEEGKQPLSPIVHADGTLTILGDPAFITSKLTEAGIFEFTSREGGVNVKKIRAPQALSIFKPKD